MPLASRRRTSEMKPMVAWFLRVFFAPATMWARVFYTCAAIIIILKADIVIDVAQYAIPEEYLFIMVVFATVAAFLASFGWRRWVHDKAAQTMIDEGKLTNQYELPYDRRYDLGTIIGFIVGIVLGIASAPVLIQLLDIHNAGQFTFALCAGGAAVIWAVALSTGIHFGLRKFLIKAREWAQQTAAEAKKTADALKDIANGHVDSAQAPAQETATIQAVPVKKN